MKSDLYSNNSPVSQPRIMGSNKKICLQSLEEQYALNEASQLRTELLDKMIAEKIKCAVLDPSRGSLGEDFDSESEIPSASLENPGLNTTFSSVAPGTWPQNPKTPRLLINYNNKS